MNVLLSAFACEPNRGSEPGVGWNYVRILAKKHQITVLTEAHQKEKILESSAKNEYCKNVSFVFLEAPCKNVLFRKNHLGNKAAIFIYYYLWQIKAYYTAKELCKTQNYDVIHHITYCVFRIPSFLSLLGKPFVWGPLGGGDSPPLSLYDPRYFGLKAYIGEITRFISNVILSKDPLIRLCAKKAASILTTTEQTKRLFGRKLQGKISVFPVNRLGNETLEIKYKINEEKVRSTPSNPKFRIIYAGQLRGLKGVHLALLAYKKVRDVLPESELIIVGEGETKDIIVKLIRNLSLKDNVVLMDWKDRASLFQLFTGCHVFLFPSLHDSSPLVVMEAMLFSLPVVCLDIGGPGLIVSEDTGIKVKVISNEQIVTDLAKAVLKLHDNEDMRKRMADNAEQFALQYSDDATVIEKMDQVYGKAIGSTEEMVAYSKTDVSKIFFKGEI